MSHTIQQSNRSFGFMFAIVFAVIVLVGWLIFDAFLLIPTVLAILFFLCGGIAPGVLLPLNRLWGRFANRLGKVSNYLVLSVLLYAVFAPVGLLFRLLGRDSLCRKLDNNAETYLSPVGRRTDIDTLNDLF